MKRLLLYILLVIATQSVVAQEVNTSDWVHKGINIPEVKVYGQRPMKEIGVQQTKFDTIALKENIALSMADVLTFNSSIFVKSYGRATLSTVAFRGTSPSHTQVSWNGGVAHAGYVERDANKQPYAGNGRFLDDTILLY